MLDADALADVEGDAVAYMKLAGYEPDDVFSIGDLSERTIGCRPRLVKLEDGEEAVLEPAGDGWDLQVDHRVPAPRARFKAAHECSHWWYERRGYRAHDLEARCDAMAAALVAPRALFWKAIRTVGHRVYLLAAKFATTQAVAFLRIGEVTGRPVLLLRGSGELQRGDPFEFPKTSSLVRALQEGRSEVHPLRIRDEPNKWGLMARR